MGETAARCILIGRLGSPMLRAGRYAGMKAVAVEADGPCRRAVRRHNSDADLILPGLSLIEGLAAGVE